VNKLLFRKLIGIWPPYLGSGIRVKKINPTFTAIDVEMKLRFWNQNYVGTQFGGSLYAMVDPFLMFILMENLGPGYIVWDKAATIRFKKPGRGTVRAHLEISKERIEEIRKQANENPKVEPVFQVTVLNEDGSTVIAEVEKTLYVRRKDQEKRPG
jgi:acyl-coenzyme A thioesterase PaaI-like protein